MTKYSLTPLSEAKKHYPEAVLGNCICWQFNDQTDDTPFGIGSNPQNAEDNGIDRIENDGVDYQGYETCFTIVVPDKTKGDPTELTDFSFIFEYEEEKQNPYEYMKEYDLTIAFSEQPRQWIGAFGNPNEINDKIFNRENQGNYFVIDRNSDRPENVDIKIAETPSFYFIEAIRKCMSLNTADAAKLLKITEKEWRSFSLEKTPMNKWQWSIFLYFFQKESPQLFLQINL